MRFPKSKLPGLCISTALLFASCSSPTKPNELAFVDTPSQAAINLEQAKQQFLVEPKTTVAVSLGNTEQPFVPLPKSDIPKAGISPSGVILPLLAKQDEEWVALTSCQGVALLDDITPVYDAHVVLDPGHGGREPGAVGYNGLRESDLNLEVAQRTKTLLEAKGASVALTRTGDYSMTVGSRGFLAEQLNPALFVSIHHNGGANGHSEKPGTIVLHKYDNEESERFGGIFYTNLDAAITPIGKAKKEAYALYQEQKEAYEKELEAYEKALQETAKATSTDAVQEQAATEETNEATSQDATASKPPEFDVEEVSSFNWSGGPNAGVRAWKRADNKDYLGVLRNSGTVPAALVEFLYLSNPDEADLLADSAFLDTQAQVLADSIVDYFSQPDLQGTGFVGDQHDDQPIGGGGSKKSCVDPVLQ